VLPVADRHIGHAVLTAAHQELLVAAPLLLLLPGIGDPLERSLALLDLFFHRGAAGVLGCAAASRSACEEAGA
jgi:hypothetical protein